MRFFTNIQSITRFFRTSLTLLVLLFSIKAWSQNYPVTCTPIVKPSYSLKWSEISTSNDMFKVHLLLKDLTKPSVDVYLKIRLSGVGVDIRTVDGFIPSQTLKLIPGDPVMLTASDLAEYFNISNIIVDGVDISSLYNGGRLPEGLYTWTVEAYEIDRNRQVSNTGMALMNVFKNYPPIINIPQDGAILPVTTPQNVLFSWTSRSTASLNAAQGKTYKLRIYPLNGDDDPNVVANSGIQPIEITTTNPYFSYGAGNIPLDKGKRYAVQVQESDDASADDYENEGKSQVVTFSYGKPCVAPEGMVINPIGKGRVELTCEASAEDTETYPVTAWYKTPKTLIWNSVPFNGNSAVISGLKDKTDYEFKLSSACGDNTNTMAALGEGDIPSGDPSTEPETFTIDDSEFDEEEPEVLDPAILDPYTIGIEINADGTTRPVETLGGIFNKIIKPECVTNASVYAECSPNHPPAPNLTDTGVLSSIAVGDVLGIYDYAVLITEVGGGTDLSGKGLVKLPFLENSYMAVEFSGVGAYKGEDGKRGGCVHTVGDYFRTRPISQADLQNEQVRTIAEIIKLTEPTVFHGDLQVAIQKYQEKGSEIASKETATAQEKQDLLTYTKGVEAAVGTWKDKFSEVFGSGETDPKIAEILGDMTAILTQLNADKQTIEVGTSYPTIPNLKEKIDAIIEKIKALQQENTPKPPRIQNVLATNIGYNDATLTWQGDPRFTKYVISYKTADGGELLETVSGNRLDLKKLQESSQYGFKIEGYVGDEVVDTYENGAFKTLKDEVPKPENLTYEAIGDTKVKIKWDYNKIHNGFKLTYKNIFGEILTVYPTSNEIILDDIIPTSIYSYDVIAFNKLKKSSEITTSSFLLASACTISIIPTKKIIKNGETIQLTVEGCSGAINWSNGNQTSIIKVSPTITTLYSVKCDVAKGSCTNQIEIEVQSDPICSGFMITATPNPVNYGKSIILSAQNCTGKISWTNLNEPYTINNDYSIELFPALSNATKTKSYSAYCQTNGISCPASTIVNLGGCFLEVNPITLSGTPLFFNQKLAVTATCSVGSLAIGFRDTQNLIYDYETFPEGEHERVWNDPKGEVKIKVICFDGTLSNVLCEKEITYPSTKNKCKNFSIRRTITKDKKYQLSTEDCGEGNTLNWKNQLTAESIAEQQLIVEYPKVPTVYEVTCGRTGCFTTIKLEPIKETDIQIEYLSSCDKTYKYASTTSSDAQIKLLNNDCSVTGLKATCQNGSELTWNTAVEFIEKQGTDGSEIYSQITASNFPENEIYTATCQNEDGTNKTITVQIIRGSNRCIQLDKIPSAITQGQKVELKANNCVGAIKWEKETWNYTSKKYDPIQTISTTNIANDSPLISTQYTVTCSGTPNCKESINVEVKPCVLITKFLLADNTEVKESSGYINNNGKPVLTNLVKMGTEIVAKATGCEAGSVEWKFDNQTIIGNPINIKPYKTTTYTATCKLNETTLCSSTPFTISIDKMPPAELECPELTLSGPPSIVRCQENNVRIDAKGCPSGSFYTWNIKGEAPLPATTNDFFNVTLSAAKTIQCSCTTAYGKTSSAEIRINTVEPAIKVSPDAVYSGYPVSLMASGCYNTDCSEGEYFWNIDGNEYTGKYIYLAEVAKKTISYRIKCKNGNPESKEIKILYPSESCGIKRIDHYAGLSTSEYVSLESSCDPNYTIIWYKRADRSDRELEFKRNFTKITVKRPVFRPRIDADGTESPLSEADNYDSYTVRCIVNSKPCEGSAIVTGLVKVNTEKVTEDVKNTPSPCADLGINGKEVEKGGFQTTWRLESGWCPGIRVEWFNKSSRTGTPIASLIPPKSHDLGKLTKTTTYYASCFLSETIKCDGGIFKAEVNKNAREVVHTEASGSGRAEIVTTTTAQTCTFTAGNAASGVIAQALCQGVNIWKVDGVINQAKVEQYVQTLVSATIVQMAAQGITVSISDDKITTAVAAIMSSGEDCSKLAEIANTLTAGNDGIIEADKFNKGVLPKYGEILDKVTPKPPTLTATTITPASCGLNNGAVKLNATGGTPPYQYSKDGTTFQSTDTFEALAVGKYTFYAKDAKGEKGNVSITIEEKTFEAPPQKIELTTIPLGNARANITANGLYIAPDGRAVRLPAGAVPIQLRFTGTWGLPPAGTLQGFEWNGSTYFAEIKGYINPSFVGYRKEEPLCPEVYLKDIYESTAGETDAFYFKKFKDANGCGIQKISVRYTFNPTGDQSLIKISPDITGDVIEKFYYTAPNACNPTNYVNKDGFKNNNTSLSADKAENLNKLTSTLNSKLGELLKVTLVAVNSADIEKMKIEAQEKGLQTLEVFEFEGVYLFAFGGGEIGTCEKDYITLKMKDVQGSDAYKTLGKWDKIIASTSTYYYNWFFAILKCRVAKEKYYTCTKDANNKETCTLKAGASEAEAFVAGFLHSVIEDLNFVEMAAGLITMAKQATTSVATDYLKYPKELYEVYQKAPNTWSGEDIYKIIPPVKPTKESVAFVSNAISFFYSYYITDANYWTSGELTAMVAPAVITGGAYLAKKLPQITSKLAGRLASKVAGLGENLNIVALFKAGKKIDYDDIGDIEQVIVKNEDEIDGIYEKVGDELVPICGFKTKGGRLVNSRDFCVLGLDESIHAGQSKFNGWISKLGLNNADAQALAQSLGTQIDGKTIYAVEEATTGRFIIQADRGAKTNKAFVIEKNNGGTYVVNKYEPTYDPTANTDIDVDISTNSYLVPDYSTKGGIYLHPVNKGKTIKIEMKGTRDKDFTEAENVISNLLGRKFVKPTDYTWHHMDDFEYDAVTGKSYCTMQLVETSAHKASGMAHSGSVAQWKAFGLPEYP